METPGRPEEVNVFLTTHALDRVRARFGQIPEDEIRARVRAAKELSPKAVRRMGLMSDLEAARTDRKILADGGMAFIVAYADNGIVVVTVFRARCQVSKAEWKASFGTATYKYGRRRSGNTGESHFAPQRNKEKLRWRPADEN